MKNFTAFPTFPTGASGRGAIVTIGSVKKIDILAPDATFILPLTHCSNLGAPGAGPAKIKTDKRILKGVGNVGGKNQVDPDKQYGCNECKMAARTGVYCVRPSQYYGIAHSSYNTAVCFKTLI